MIHCKIAIHCHEIVCIVAKVIVSPRDSSVLRSTPRPWFGYQMHTINTWQHTAMNMYYIIFYQHHPLINQQDFALRSTTLQFSDLLVHWTTLQFSDLLRPSRSKAILQFSDHQGSLFVAISQSTVLVWAWRLLPTGALNPGDGTDTSNLTRWHGEQNNQDSSHFSAVYISSNAYVLVCCCNMYYIF